MNTSLTEIYLHHNEIGDEGKAIGEPLKVNAWVTEFFYIVMKLVMKERQWRSVESEYLADKIHLRDNKIGDEGPKAIGEALKVTHR